MTTLSKRPYFLRGGDLILARARVQDAITGRWGPFSKTTQQSVATMVTPRQPASPTLDKWNNEEMSSATILFGARHSNDPTDGLIGSVTYNVYYSTWRNGKKYGQEHMRTVSNPYFTLENIRHGH